jgi:hypothetical protein
LKSLNLNSVEYLLIGGYAVAAHGHVRATNDLDVWVKISAENATRIECALRQFGFATPALAPDLFLIPNNVVRMGVPPIRIEILTSISGVEFESCYAEKEMIRIEEVTVPVIQSGSPAGKQGCQCAGEGPGGSGESAGVAVPERPFAKHYSYLSATVGSTRMARRAGI